jgi:predicted DNA binding CopG/RHH family protein
MLVRAFEWDDSNREHVARHQIDSDEVEEAFAGKHHLFKSRRARHDPGRNAPLLEKDMKSAKKSPRLRRERAVHDYWARHSLADQLKDTHEIDEKIQLDPELARKIAERTKKKMIALRLEQWQLQRTKAIAARKRIPYQHLLRYWITQGLKQEAAG